MFNDKLIEKRKKLNITQSELSNKINIKQSTISDYEKGKILPSLEVLIKMCNLFDCSSDELLEIKFNPVNAIDNLYKFYINFKINFTNDMTFLLKNKKNIDDLTETEKSKYYIIKNKIILIDILITAMEELKKYNDRLMELI